jgi:hypothetical protein
LAQVALRCAGSNRLCGGWLGQCRLPSRM